MMNNKQIIFKTVFYKNNVNLIKALMNILAEYNKFLSLNSILCHNNHEYKLIKVIFYSCITERF